MKSLAYKLSLAGIVLAMSAISMSKTVELTAELDRPVIMADAEQTVYLSNLFREPLAPVTERGSETGGATTRTAGVGETGAA